MLFALCLSVEAQQPAKISRIGVLSSSGNSGTPGSQIEAFRQGLRDLGYIEGKNILVEYRYAEGEQDRIPSLVTELVQLKVDVLVVTALTAVRAAKQATKTTPVVMVILSDPVATGLVDSLARPGGNITGFTRLTRELNGKRLELLKEAIPGISSAAVYWDADAPGAAATLPPSPRSAAPRDRAPPRRHARGRLLARTVERSALSPALAPRRWRGAVARGQSRTGGGFQLCARASRPPAA